MRDRRAFTLVELLVVLGIIAVLIGVLLPAVGQARRESWRAKCLANLRSMQVAQWMYVSENRGYLIQGGMAHGGQHADEKLAWFETLNRYYQNRLLPRCPADVSPYWDVPLPPAGVQMRVTSYGINAFLDRELCPWGPGFENPVTRPYVKIEQIRRPSEIVQFLEMAYAGDFAASDHVHPDQFASSRGFTSAAAVAINMSRQMQVHAHGGRVGQAPRANYGFLDGHAETLRASEVFESYYVLNKFDPASPQPR